MSEMRHQNKLQQLPLSDRELLMDPSEQNQKGDLAVLQALHREHPERFTTRNPPGTKSPRRLSAPGGVSIHSNLEG